MADLTSAAGILSIAAALVALAALVAALTLHSRLRRLRAGQEVVLGESSQGDLVAHAARLEARVGELQTTDEARAVEFEARLSHIEERLDRALSHSAVIRYDAYGEMSGRQSSSIAILDDHANGVIVSSILHREQARVYAKRVAGGTSDLGTSPEEEEAVRTAMDQRAEGGT